MNNDSILIAEDSDTDWFFLQNAVERARIGNQIIRVPDGVEVIEYLKGDGIYSDRGKFPLPFLVLLDLNMPKMNGFEALAWIRSKPLLKRLVVVVLTSSNNGWDVSRAYDLGANSYLVKTANFDDFAAMVERIHGYWFLTNVRPDLTSISDEPPAIGFVTGTT